MALDKRKNPYEVDEEALRNRYRSERAANAGTYGNRRLRDPGDLIYTGPDKVSIYDPDELYGDKPGTVPAGAGTGAGNPMPPADTGSAQAETTPAAGIGVAGDVAGDGRPSYSGTYDALLEDLYNQITGRPDFSYDAASDPLWQNYRDQYIQGGKLAMRDTMGQAAALTGGYGSSYGQQVGQQAYDAYLQKLSEAVPELYGLAYNKWSDEGNRLLQQYQMLGQQRDTEYGRYRDELGDWERERDWQHQLQNEQYSQQQQAYANLYSLILSSGYNPTDAELAAAGMTREAADALRGEYTRQTTPQTTGSSGGGGGGGGGGSGYSSGIAQLQQYLNSLGESLDVDGLIGPLTRAAAARHGLNADDYLNGFTSPGNGGGSSGGYTLGELLSSSSSGYNAEQILDGLAAQGVPITDAVIEDVLWARGK